MNYIDVYKAGMTKSAAKWQWPGKAYRWVVGHIPGMGLGDDVKTIRAKEYLRRAEDNKDLTDNTARALNKDVNKAQNLLGVNLVDPTELNTYKFAPNSGTPAKTYKEWADEWASFNKNTYEPMTKDSQPFLDAKAKVDSIDAQMKLINDELTNNPGMSAEQRNALTSNLQRLDNERQSAYALQEQYRIALDSKYQAPPAGPGTRADIDAQYNTAKNNMDAAFADFKASKGMNDADADLLRRTSTEEGRRGYLQELVDARYPNAKAHYDLQNDRVKNVALWGSIGLPVVGTGAWLWGPDVWRGTKNLFTKDIVPDEQPEVKPSSGRFNRKNIGNVQE